MPAVAGWPKTVAAGVGELPCPIVGLDRCTSGNTMRSPTIAVDDTNANHLFYAYAVSTGTGNEDVVVRDSTDGGSTWSAATKLNTVGTGRRYMAERTALSDSAVR